MGEGNDPAILVSLMVDQANSRSDKFDYRIRVSEASLVTNSKILPGRVMTALASPLSGASVQFTASVSDALSRIARTYAMSGGGIVTFLVIGWVLVCSLSHELSAPLTYLVVQAEQVGLGSVRARMKKSGTKGIDLVSEELARTDERMAGRLAAE